MKTRATHQQREFQQHGARLHRWRAEYLTVSRLRWCLAPDQRDPEPGFRNCLRSRRQYDRPLHLPKIFRKWTLKLRSHACEWVRECERCGMKTQARAVLRASIADIANN